MYFRTVKSRGYEYVQLAHNYRDPEPGASRAKVLFNFGRKDQQDVEGLTRLEGCIARFLEKHDFIAIAVTRGGIPVRSWLRPGNTSDQQIIKEVKKDLNRWQLGRVVMVQAAGFNSEENKRLLQTAGGHYIIGEKLRQGRKCDPVEALSKPGRYTTLENGLEIKEVILDKDSEARRRYILVRNPDEARRAALNRADIVKEVERRLEELKQLAGQPHKKAACAIRAHSVYGRYVWQTKSGMRMLDKA